MSKMLKLRGIYLSVPNKMPIEEADEYARYVEGKDFQTKPRRVKVQVIGEYIELTYMFADKALTERLVR